VNKAYLVPPSAVTHISQKAAQKEPLFDSFSLKGESLGGNI
jgi:hypothetical protein